MPNRASESIEAMLASSTRYKSTLDPTGRSRHGGQQLNRDAGYDPVYAGPIENAALPEGMVKIVFAISEGMGPFVYRMAPLEQL